MQRTKRGNPHHLLKPRKRGQHTPSSFRQQRAPSTVAQAAEPLERARLTLHDSDPITGNEDMLSTLFYEYYRGYTIYSTPDGSCCMHGKQECIKLQSKFVCFADVAEAKALIKRFRVEGYTSYDSMERYLPEWEYVCLNRHEQQRTPSVSCATQSVP
jgi:hypothetical protein